MGVPCIGEQWGQVVAALRQLLGELRRGDDLAERHRCFTPVSIDRDFTVCRGVCRQRFVNLLA